MTAERTSEPINIPPSLFCSREIYPKSPPALGCRPPAYPKLVAVAGPFCCKMAECCSAGVLVLPGHSPAPSCSTPRVRLQAQRRLQNTRANHAAVELQDGRVLAGGGVTSGGGVTNWAEIQDPCH